MPVPRREAHPASSSNLPGLDLGAVSCMFFEAATECGGALSNGIGCAGALTCKETATLVVSAAHFRVPDSESGSAFTAGVMEVFASSSTGRR